MEKLSIQNPGRRTSLLRLGLRLILAVAVVSGLALFALLVWSTGNASRFAQHYDLLLLFNGVLAVALIVWVLMMTARLARQIRRRQFGSRLTARFALSFALVGVLPGVIVYLLSVQFMSRSIESWFNVRVESALEAGLSLGRAALDTQLEELTARTKAAATRLSSTEDLEMASVLQQVREAVGAVEVMVFAGNGRPLAFSSSTFGQLIPEGPTQHVMSRLRVARQYAEAEADDSGPGRTGQEGGLHLRVVMPISTMDRVPSLSGATLDSRWLQVIQPVPEKIARSASLVQQGFGDYQELALSRLGLRKLYGITLTLALVLSVFAAIVAALAISRRLVRPLLTLAAGTQAVAVGDYRPLHEPPEKDELGQLTRSFNAMTRQLDDARRTVEANRHQLERSNVYLESVLSNLSSGVLVFDAGFRVTLFNQGAQTILQADLRSVKGCPLEVVEQTMPFAQQIRQAFAAHAAVGSERQHWQQQFELTLPEQAGKGQHVVTLLARGTNMSLDGRSSGYLVVFDDISEVISANRAVAWAEVARRLAHEIKNPLTPIQLSAERVAHKLAGRLPPDEAAMLTRAIETIVNQVASLKQMVDDFREYARTPPAQMRPVNLNALVADVLSLYGWDPAAEQPRLDGQTIRLAVSLDPELPDIEGDATQLRQVIHNLLANARDALHMGVAGGEGAPQIEVQTRLVRSELEEGRTQLAAHLMISDNGPGFEPRVLARVFEPYVTTKATGTGLGLAIVRKIIEEHGGRIDVSNRRAGGARVSALFTRFAQAPAGMDGGALANDNAAKI